jgi:hypothetical protein
LTVIEFAPVVEHGKAAFGVPQLKICTVVGTN